MELILYLAVTLVLGSIGFFFGRRAERRHFVQIHAQEQQLSELLVFTQKRLPSQMAVRKTELVVGSVVIAEDYFKRIVSGLRNLFGGRLVAYESLLDRARREAVIRMKSKAAALGASAVFNVRFETSTLSEDRPNALFCAEVMCYGTAVVTEDNP